MDVEQPAFMQILVAWRDSKWVVLRDPVEVGAYAYRTHAMDTARRLSAQAAAAGLDCRLLIRERDGRWDEHPCRRPARRSGG